MADPKISWAQSAAWRVRRQYLDRRAPAGAMLAVAGRLCGLHAQVLSSAELTAWARIDGLERGAVASALWQERTLIKSWFMRGTLHLLPAADLPMWHAALATSPRYLRPAVWEKYYGVTLEELDRLTHAVGEALDGRMMTREELFGELIRITGSPALGSKLAQNSWGTILKPAAFTGRLCFGPSLGQRVRFTRPDTWLRARLKRVDAQTALAGVLRRYLAVYAPATLHDLARWWGGGGITSARQWLASLAGEVCSVDLEGVRAWMPARDVREIRRLEPGKTVNLLPGFDQYVVAASCHAARLMPENLRARVYRPQGWISPVLLVNGMIQGTWSYRKKGSRVEVAIEPFAKIPAWVRRAAGAEAERLAAFFGARLALEFRPPR